MALIVQKFGGTSVADPDKIKMAAKRAIETKKKGNQIVVVVSAMGGTTDHLVSLAGQITKTPPKREMDMLLATGEQVSVAMIAMAIHELGEKAESLTGAQVGIITDSYHTKAKIKGISTDRLKASLDAGNIVIVAGFQGIDEHMNITTLGRGGSDTTAVALAAVLEADVCDIFTDVDGVFSTDPRIVPNARKLERIAYDEMLELASVGAKVLMPRSVEFAKKYGVPIHVRSSFHDAPGTMVTAEVEEMEEIIVSGAALDEDEAKVTLLGIPDVPGMAAKIFCAVAAAQLNIDMIVQNISADGLTDLSFTVAQDDLSEAIKVADALKDELNARDVTADADIAKLSIVGVGMRSHAGIAKKMFSALAKEEINIKMISTSAIKVSCVIERQHAKRALTAVHDAFELDKPPQERTPTS